VGFLTTLTTIVNFQFYFSLSHGTIFEIKVAGFIYLLSSLHFQTNQEKMSLCYLKFNRELQKVFTQY
jgi:hypothetical protein